MKNLFFILVLFSALLCIANAQLYFTGYTEGICSGPIETGPISLDGTQVNVLTIDGKVYDLSIVKVTSTVFTLTFEEQATPSNKYILDYTIERCYEANAPGKTGSTISGFNQQTVLSNIVIEFSFFEPIEALSGCTGTALYGSPISVNLGFNSMVSTNPNVDIAVLHAVPNEVNLKMRDNTGTTPRTFTLTYEFDFCHPQNSDLNRDTILLSNLTFKVYAGGNGCTGEPQDSVDLIYGLNDNAILGVDFDITVLNVDPTKYEVTLSGDIEFFYNYTVNSCLASGTADINGNMVLNDTLLDAMDGGEVAADPHFYPLNSDEHIHQMYYSPSTTKDGVFNIFTNHFFQWNTQWKIFTDILFLYHNPQFVTKEALRIKHPQDPRKEVKILFEIDTDKVKYNYLKVSINHEISSNSSLAPTFTKSVNVLPYKLVVAKKYFLFGKEFPQFFITMINKAEALMSTPYFQYQVQTNVLHPSFAAAKTKEQKALDKSRTFFQWTYLDASIEVEENAKMEDSHGLLGQTLRTNNPYKTPYQGCFSCFVEGKTEDYRIPENKLFGVDPKHNKY